MTDTIDVDVAIVGAGIAGVGVAAELAGHYRTAIIEQESRPAYHSTGRSAAIFIGNYGNAVIRELNRASAPLFEKPDTALFPHPLIARRGLLFVADEAALKHHNELLEMADGMRPISIDEAIAMVPIMRRDWLVAAAYEDDAQDIDVAALHEGWLRKARAGGAKVLTDAPMTRGERKDGKWLLETRKGTVSADIVVNAAGAWADPVATACGVKTLGVQPMRRSIAVLPAPDGLDPTHWPCVDHSSETWYFKPDAGKLFVSPSEEIPVEPHDAYVDDMVLAEGLDRFCQATTYELTHVENSWAGLRNFAPDRTPVCGFSRGEDGFFWLAGQGGYGIQTAPALSRLASRLIRQAEPDADVAGVVDALSPNRFSI